MKGLILKSGSTGDAVRDLQWRLAAQGIDVEPDSIGEYGDGTEAAVRLFQERARIYLDGICGPYTWAALVESGYRLGDRQLYFRSPMTRGDDVADLQRCLGALGFDAGRADGIFGPNTATALADFQRNTGLPVDGILGPESMAALARLGQGRTTAISVAHVHEQLRLLDSSRQLKGRRLVVAEPGGLGALAYDLSHRVREAGALVITIEHPDPSTQARETNAFDADLYLGMRLRPTAGLTVSYYESSGYVSVGGQHLASLVAQQLRPVLNGVGPVEIVGHRLPVLRETRMPAVLCEIGTARSVVEHLAVISSSLAAAISCWVKEPAPNALLATPTSS